MGLSREERFLYTLEALVEFERGLDHPEVCRWYNKDRLQPYIDELKELIAQMTGWIIQKADKTTEYLDSYRGHGSLHNLKLSYFFSRSMSIYDLLYEDNLRNLEKDELSMSTFAHMAGFSRDGLRNIAYWWDLWEYIGTLLAYINRYRDGLFEVEFHKLLNRLIFSMIKMRRNMEIDANEEDVLLFKYFVYVSELKQNPEGIEGPKRHRDIVDRVVKLTQEELRTKVEDIQLRDIQQRGKYTSRPKPKIDPVVGDTETAEDQVRRVNKEVLKQTGLPPHRRSTIMALIKDQDENKAVQRLVELIQEQNKDHSYRLCAKCYLDIVHEPNYRGWCKSCLDELSQK